MTVENPEEQPVDVLAAEEFPVGDRDEHVHDRDPEPPHDVLAADEFAVPGPDPVLHADAPLSPAAIGGAVAGAVGTLWLLLRRRRKRRRADAE